MGELIEEQSNGPSSTEPQPQDELRPAVQHIESQQTVHQPVAPQPTRHQPKLWRWPSWTGLSGKTAWDWLQLFLALAIPIAVLSATLVFSAQQDKANKAQHDNDLKIAQGNRQNDLKIADDQQQEATLKSYLDDMTTLLLDKKLGSKAVADKAASDEAAVIARAKTLTVLRRLTDPRRKTTVVQFLYEAHLIGYCSCTFRTPGTPVKRIIDLSGADLSLVDLYLANLRGADLSRVDLSRAILDGAFLSGADLSDANLHLANLSDADLNGAFLSGADLSDANLHGANLNGAFLNGADLSNAFLSNTFLIGAFLIGVNLNGADLRGADLNGTNLSKAQVTQAQLDKANSLHGATMPDGSKHP